MPSVELPTGPTVYYEETGSGPGTPVVFSHGLFMDHTMFRPQVERFAQERRCIAWDERAHGRTVSSGPFTFWDSARDLVALLDHLGIEKAVHVGMSQGGLLGLRAILQNPERFAGLVMLSSQAGQLAEEGADDFKRIIDEWVENGATEDKLTFLTNLILGPGVDATYWRQAWKSMTAQQVREANDAIFALEDITDQLEKISCPVWVIHGTGDVSTPYQRAETVAAKVPDCRGLTLIDDAPHAANLSHPEQVNEAIAEFLKQIP
jgi:3-oxoadipate enol-lactonase